MKKLLFVLTAAVLLSPVVSQARDTVYHLDFQSVVDEAIRSGKLDGTVKFYLERKNQGERHQDFP